MAKVKFIRRHGRVIPIYERAGRVVKGATKDAASAAVTGTLINMMLLKAPPKAAFQGSLKFAAAWGGLSAAVRTASQISAATRRKRNG